MMAAPVCFSLFLFLLVITCETRDSEAKLWSSWFAASDRHSTFHVHQDSVTPSGEESGRPGRLLEKFDIDSGSILSSSTAGRDLVERARHQSATDSCWHRAYSGLLASCREILREEELKARLAMRLTNCFLRASGRGAAITHCSDSTPILKCTSALNDHVHSIFLAFFIDSASMCHHLQSEAFKLETEHVVNDLKGSAHFVEEKLKTMEIQASSILQHSGELISEQKRMHLDMQEYSEQLRNEQKQMHSEMQEQIKTDISGLSLGTMEVHKQLEGVTSMQKEMVDQQQALASSLAMEFSNMAVEFSSLQEKTYQIGDGVLRSLRGQAELLAGQDKAFQDLLSLKSLQEQAMEESRASVHELTSEARIHQQDFQAWQIELHGMHQQLAKGSTAMLQAQDAFASKQAAVFASLEQLFTLHNTILLESRGLKTFLFYALSSVFLYMATSTKQTYNARALLYCDLFLMLAVELLLVRYHQTSSMMFFPRLAFSFTAVCLLIYSIITYRDYNMLSYDIMLDVQQQLRLLQHPLGPIPDRGGEEDLQTSSACRSKVSLSKEKLAKKIVRRARTSRSKLL
ncbi:hypothetical protein BDL97_09G041400 [Sphagnum fallax]|nr:hypothetical protein BDL97_09G041400 [Sphagnum fallax]